MASFSKSSKTALPSQFLSMDQKQQNFNGIYAKYIYELFFKRYKYSATENEVKSILEEMWTRLSDSQRYHFTYVRRIQEYSELAERMVEKKMSPKIHIKLSLPMRILPTPSTSATMLVTDKQSSISTSTSTQMNMNMNMNNENPPPLNEPSTMQPNQTMNQNQHKISKHSTSKHKKQRKRLEGGRRPIPLSERRRSSEIEEDHS